MGVYMDITLMCSREVVRNVMVYVLLVKVILNIVLLVIVVDI